MYRLQITSGKLTCLFLLLVFTSFGVFSQDTDSLAGATGRMPDDTQKVHALYLLTTKISDTTRAFAYGKSMLALSQKLKYAKGEAMAWQGIAQVYFRVLNLKTAIFYYEKSTGLYKGTNYARGTMACYHGLARCYRRLADYTQYGKYLALLMDLANRQHDDEYLSYAYEGYGNLYRYLGNYPKSIENYTKAIEIAEKSGRLRDASIALNNLSLVYGSLGQSNEELKIQLRNYNVLRTDNDSANMVLCLSNLGGIYSRKGKMDSARYFVELAMKIIKMKGEANINFKDAASVYGEYAGIASGSKDYLTAVEYYNKAIRLSQNNQDVKSVASGYSNIANVFLLMGNKSMAEEYFLKSLEINKAIPYISGLIENYNSLAEFYAAQNNFQKAFTNMQTCARLKDSLAALTNTRKLAEAEALYRIKEQQHEIFLLSQHKQMQDLELEKKKYLAYALTGGLALATLLAVILFMRYRKNVTARTANGIAEQKRT